MKTFECTPTEIFDYMDRLRSLGYAILDYKKVDDRVIVIAKRIFELHSGFDYFECA